MLNEIVINYFSSQPIESNAHEIKATSPGELLLNDLLRGGVLHTLVCSSAFIDHSLSPFSCLAHDIDGRWMRETLRVRLIYW